MIFCKWYAKGFVKGLREKTFKELMSLDEIQRKKLIKTICNVILDEYLPKMNKEKFYKEVFKELEERQK